MMEKLYRQLDKIDSPTILQGICDKTQNVINQLNEDEEELKNDLKNIVEYTNNRIADLFK